MCYRALCILYSYIVLYTDLTGTAVGVSIFVQLMFYYIQSNRVNFKNSTNFLQYILYIFVVNLFFYFVVIIYFSFKLVFL